MSLELSSLSRELAFLLAALAVVAIFMAGMLFYRVVLARVLGVLHAANPEAAKSGIKRLTLPYYVMLSVLAANAARIAYDGPPAWWLGACVIPAVLYFGIELLRLTVVDAVVQARGRAPVPRILKDVAFGILYLTAGLICLGTVFKVDVAPFLTTSAILSVVIGLALQDTLGNLFAGIAINLDQPFMIGDWIEVDGVRGEVHEITWRATKVLTRQQELIIIPNSQIGRARVMNYSKPTSTYGEVVPVRVHYDVPPNKVRDAVNAAVASIPEIKYVHANDIQLMGFGEFSVDYRVIIWIEDAENANPIKSRFRERLWYQFRRDGIAIPYPIRTVYQHDPAEEERARFAENLQALRQVTFIEALDEPTIAQLARDASALLFARGEAVFRQGDVGRTFYVIMSGSVDLYLESEDESVLLTKLTPGSYFGEMSLLTGEVRSATAKAAEDTVLLRLEKRQLEPILAQNPDILESISRIVSERRIEREIARKALTERERLIPKASNDKRAVEAASRELLGKIRSFFKLS